MSVVFLQSNEAIFQACLSQLTPDAQAALSSVLSTWTRTVGIIKCRDGLPSSACACAVIFYLPLVSFIPARFRNYARWVTTNAETTDEIRNIVVY